MAKAKDHASNDSPEPAWRDGNALDRTVTSTDQGAPGASAVGPDRLAADTLALLDLPTVPTHVYQFENEIGRGGVGVVTQARDRRLARRVAVKQLQLLERASQARFEREMRITAGLQHPGIVPVHEAGVLESGSPFYAMKLIEGRTLKAAIAESSLLVERLKLLPRFASVVEAIAYAHSRGVIHRDIKPSNIVLGEYGETVVIDWGIAKELREPEDHSAPHETSGSTDLTYFGQVVGTPAYMPLEQARGLELDERADVYSLGAVLRQILTGKPPYAASSATEVLACVLRESPASLASECPEAPADLVAVVDKAMARDRNERYSTAGALLEDLRVFMEGRLVRAYQYGRGERIRKWFYLHSAIAYTVAGALAITVVLSTVGAWQLRKQRDRAIRNESIATALQASQAKKTAELLLEQAARESEAGDSVRSLELLSQYPASGDDWRRVREIAGHLLAAGLPVRTMGPARKIAAIAVSDDSTRLYGVEPGILWFWRLDLPGSGAKKFSLDRMGNLQISRVLDRSESGGDRLTIATVEGTVAIVDFDSARDEVRGQVKFQPCASGIVDAAQSEEGRIALACVEGGISVIDPSTKVPQHGILADEHFARIAFIRHDGTSDLVAHGSSGSLSVIDLRDPSHRSKISSVASFAGNENCPDVLLADAAGRLKRLDLSSMTVAPVVAPALSSVHRMSLSETCEELAVHDVTGRELTVLRLTARGAFSRYRGPGANIEFSPQEDAVWISSDLGGGIERIDLSTLWHDRWRSDSEYVRAMRRTRFGVVVLGSELSMWPLRSSVDPISLSSAAVTLASSSDDQSVVVGEEGGSIEEIDVLARTVTKWDSPHAGRVLVKVGQNDTFFSAGSSDGCVYRWTPTRQSEFGYCSSGGVLDIAVSREGEVVYTISNLGNVEGYDFGAHRHIFTLTPEFGLRRIGADFFHDRVLVGTQDGSVMAFDRHLDRRQVFRQHDGAISHVGAAPDGDIIALTLNGSFYKWSSPAHAEKIGSCNSTAWRGWSGPEPFIVVAACQNGRPESWPEWSGMPLVIGAVKGVLDVDFGSSPDVLAFSATGGDLEVIDRSGNSNSFITETMGAPHNIEVLPSRDVIVSAIAGYDGLASWRLSSQSVPANSNALHEWLVRKTGEMR